MKREVGYLVALILVSLISVGLATWTIYELIPKVHSYGKIRVIGVQVYADAGLTQILDHIDWGVLDPGENRSQPAWIKNIGNDAQKLVMWTEAWQPVNASDWIFLSWDYGWTWIPANASIPVVFTLSVDSNIENITSFRFEIWVKGVH